MRRFGAWVSSNQSVIVIALLLTTIVVFLVRDRAERAAARAANARRQDAIIANTDLLKDCVGLTEGGPCQARLKAQQGESLKIFAANLIAQLAPALTKALEEKFGILQGRLIIRLEQGKDGEQVVTVGSQNPGQTPGKQIPLSLGGSPGPSPSPRMGTRTLVQECVVELHTEPLVGACVVPR
jgi:hypothetical protein